MNGLPFPQSVRAITTLAFILTLMTARSHAEDALRLEPILQVARAEGHRLINQSMRHVLKNTDQNISTAFVAVVATEWPANLVPVFAVETAETFELRRLPPRGQENYTEPLFFALPPEDETNALKITGKWSGLAANAQRSNHSPDWELAIDGERVAGRFDPHGEYRVAFMSGGVFRSNRLQLTVEYINDRYILDGVWRHGRLSGTWRQVDESEHGTWEASRPASMPRVQGAANSIPLFEWKRGKERRYSVLTNLHETGWQRSGRPLGRVWK
jgi:hypothetical protein